MKIENPVAFSFIMPDDIYLLNKDKSGYNMPVSPVPVTETFPLNFKYLGGHKKSFLVITHYPGIEFMAETHLAALESTLKRLEFTIEDTAILNRANYPDATLEHYTAFFEPQKLLILGTQALPAGTENLEQNKLQQLNSCNTLFTFSFDEMMDNTAFKKAFWEQMKQL